MDQPIKKLVLDILAAVWDLLPALDGKIADMPQHMKDHVISGAIVVIGTLAILTYLAFFSCKNGGDRV